MNILRAGNVALDVVREAFARKLMIGLFIFIALGLGLLLFALDLEVVEGTLAAGRLFGMELDNAIIPIDVAMKQVFGFLTYATFYLGMVFGLVATSGIAADMLAPGRVEFLLALPVRRTELVVGTYLGVLAIGGIATSVAVGGATLILFAKTSFFTLAPLLGALTCVVGFSAVYGAMLLATSLVRSSALAAGIGFLTFLVGAITSNRAQFLEVVKPGITRDVVDVILTPLPRFHKLATAGADAATGMPFWDGDTAALVLHGLAFAVACVIGACFVVSEKDY